MWRLLACMLLQRSAQLDCCMLACRSCVAKLLFKLDEGAGVETVAAQAWLASGWRRQPFHRPCEYMLCDESGSGQPHTQWPCSAGHNM